MPRPVSLLRGLLAAWATLALALALSVARADGPLPRPRPSDVIESIRGEVALPPAPAGYVTRTHGPVTYELHRSLLDELDGIERRRAGAMRGITEDLGRATDERMLVRIGRNDDEMRALAPIGLPPPSYASGVAYPPLGLVLLTKTTRNPGDPVPDLGRVLVHEASHVALHRAAGGRSVPRWFTEGMAVYHASENDLARIETLWRAAAGHNLVPLATLDAAFADDETGRVDVAYAQSVDLVSFLLRQHHGGDKMRRLLARVAAGASFGEALEHAYFLSLADLERTWTADLDDRHGSYAYLLAGSGLWMLALVAITIGYVRRRRRNRRVLEKWANEDAAIDSLEAELERKLAHIEEARRARTLH